MENVATKTKSNKKGDIFVASFNKDSKKGILNLTRLEIVVPLQLVLGKSSRMGTLVLPLPQWGDLPTCIEELPRLIEVLQRVVRGLSLNQKILIQNEDYFMEYSKVK